MTRRPLGVTLLDVLLGAVDAMSVSPALALRSLTVTLPVEVALSRTAGEWEILADVPRAVTRTAFDTRPGRLEVSWVTGDAA